MKRPTRKVAGAIDRRVQALLLEHGHQTTAELVEALGVSGPAVYAALDWLRVKALAHKVLTLEDDGERVLRWAPALTLNYQDVTGVVLDAQLDARRGVYVGAYGEDVDVLRLHGNMRSVVLGQRQ